MVDFVVFVNELVEHTVVGAFELALQGGILLVYIFVGGDTANRGIVPVLTQDVQAAIYDCDWHRVRVETEVVLVNLHCGGVGERSRTSALDPEDLDFVQLEHVRV